MEPRKRRTHSWASILLALFAVVLPRPARAVFLEVWDLASLYGMAEIVVLVDDFVPTGPASVGHGTVTRVYKGEMTTGSGIAILPWGTDLSRGRGLPPGEPSGSMRAVFFLERQPELPAAWAIVPSGVRAIIDERVFGLAPSGARTYAFAPARREGLGRLPKGETYGLRHLEHEIGECRGRLRDAGMAVGATANRKAREKLWAVAEAERRRVFGGGPINSSLLVSRLGTRLVEVDELDRAWQLKDRVPARGVGREIRHAFAESVPSRFFVERIDGAHGAGETRRVLAYLRSADVDWLPTATRVDALDALLDRLPSWDKRLRPPACATAAHLYRRVPLAAVEDDVTRRVVAFLRTGEAAAVFELGPALSERRPQRIASECAEWYPLFGRVDVSSADFTHVRGRIALRRFATGDVFSDPVLVLERVEAGGRTSSTRRYPVKVPAHLLVRAAFGEAARGFTMRFGEGELGRGHWRVALELHRRKGDTTGEWRTAAAEFTVSK